MHVSSSGDETDRSDVHSLVHDSSRQARETAVRELLSAGFGGTDSDAGAGRFVLVAAEAVGDIDLREIGMIAATDREVPVIVRLSAAAPAAERARLFEVGARDVIAGEVTPQELRRRVLNGVDAQGARRREPAGEGGPEEEIRSAIGEIMLREHETLYLLGKASEYKDQETGTHIVRVAHYSRLIARMIGESEARQEVVFHASPLHDIGKLGVPDAVLLKPGTLDRSELTIMRNHCVSGHAMLKDSQSSYLLTGAMIALTHHEWYDGSGYPMGLRGGDIPLYGRIVCVADVFDALTTRRPYKAPWHLDGAFEYLRSQRGKHFDPQLVDAFVYNEHVVRDIFYRHADAEPARVGCSS